MCITQCCFASGGHVYSVPAAYLHLAIVLQVRSSIGEKRYGFRRRKYTGLRADWEDAETDHVPIDRARSVLEVLLELGAFASAIFIGPSAGVDVVLSLTSYLSSDRRPCGVHCGLVVCIAGAANRCTTLAKREFLAQTNYTASFGNITSLRRYTICV